MLFSVRHLTTYRYSAPVRLGTHRLLFTPRPDAGARISHRLVVEPTPVARREEIDGFGNLVTVVDFDGETDRFVVDSRFEVETRAADPGLPPVELRLPFSAGPGDPLAAYRGAAEPAVAEFAAAIASTCRGDVRGVLDRLNRTLHERTHHHIRPHGAAQTPAETLASGRGACRDTAVLFIAAVRSLGLAARFVSGYQARADTADGKRHLHAWPEVHLPGVGWRGFDPTHGLAVSDGHVAVAAAPDQAATMPISGGFWGTGVTSTLTYEVEIEAEE